jgi:hypothetical protein
MRALELDDPAAARPLRIPLSVNDPSAGATLTRSVERLLRDRRGAQVVVELYGEHLPAPLVASLIASLRRLREVGGALAVNAATPALRGAIAQHGLDRILSRGMEPASRAPRGPLPLGETAWPVFALILLLTTIAAVVVLLELNPAYGGF